MSKSTREPENEQLLSNAELDARGNQISELMGLISAACGVTSFISSEYDNPLAPYTDVMVLLRTANDALYDAHRVAHKHWKRIYGEQTARQAKKERTHA